MRALFVEWNAAEIAEGFAAIVGVGIVSMTLAMLALRGRVKRG
jgi:hypothetical protein